MKRHNVPLLLASLVLLVAPRASAQEARPAPAVAASVAPAVAPGPTGGQKEQGFALEPHVYAQMVMFSGGLAGSLTAPLVTGGLFAGYKLDRVLFGLGFDFSSYDAGGAQIAMRWVPGVRVAIVRSSDERVEIFGQLDVSLGHDFGAPVGNELIGVKLGPGVRYWVHPQFAFSAVGGWDGNWQLYDRPSNKTVLQGIFAGVQALAVF